MKTFMDKDFLLETETARTLYHEYAAKMPIIDYHCHINPQEIYENRRFDNFLLLGVVKRHLEKDLAGFNS